MPKGIPIQCTHGFPSLNKCQACQVQRATNLRRLKRQSLRDERPTDLQLSEREQLKLARELIKLQADTIADLRALLAHRT
jgi:hypothetical protein